MKSLSIVFIFCLIGLIACRDQEPPEPVKVVRYEKYLKPVEGAVFKNGLSGSLISPPFIPRDRYDYRSPIFNPSNPYEVAYIRRDHDKPRNENDELFVFNFETGIARFVINNHFSDLAWNSDGWLYYTGMDGNLWKIKSTGDRNTLHLPFGYLQYNRKWSPSGEKFACNDVAGDLQLRSIDGDTLKQTTFKYRLLDWLNEEEVLVGLAPLGGMAVFNWETEELRYIFEGGSFLDLSYFDRSTGRAFSDRRGAENRGFVQFDLVNQLVDTIAPSYESYFFQSGD